MKYKVKAHFTVNNRSFEIDTRTHSLNRISVQDAMIIDLYYRYYSDYYGKGIFEKIQAELRDEFHIAVSTEAIRAVTKNCYKEEMSFVCDLVTT